MVEINKGNLENALGQNNSQAAGQPQVPKEEEVGYHKGALNTLVAERNELFKMIQNVEAFMQMHAKRLEELGVKIQTEQQKK